jgi:transcriptional regulator with XRE-family HTH domain
MALELGVSRPTISAWEAGTHPPFWAVVRWAQVTGASLAWLSGEDVGDGSPVIHDPAVQLALAV